MGPSRGLDPRLRVLSLLATLAAGLHAVQLISSTGLLQRLGRFPPVLELALLDRIQNLGFFLLIATLLALTGTAIRSSASLWGAAATAGGVLVFRIYVATSHGITLSIIEALIEGSLLMLWWVTARRIAVTIPSTESSSLR